MSLTPLTSVTCGELSSHPNSASNQLMTPEKLSITAGLSQEVAFVLEQFLNLTAIPRPSHQEQLATQFICNLATANGWDFTRDDLGNVIVRVPGKGAGVGALPVALQAHLDMVCVPAERDFFATPITVTRELHDVNGRQRDSLMAEGSTLGADNGIGVAAALSIALLKDVDHPPLELVFTTNEEDGMTGVRGLKAGAISSTWLINIDSEDFGVITQSAAGARDARIKINLQRDKAPYYAVPVVIELDDLAGGHSGTQVHERRGNANIILARCLASLDWQELGISLADFKGGDRRNSIPAKAKATLWCSKEQIEKFHSQLESALRDELKRVGSKGLSASLSLTEVSDQEALEPLVGVSGAVLMNVLGAVPDGVVAWSKEVPDLVETSSTLSLVESNENTLSMTMMTRSSRDGAAREFQDRALVSLIELAHANVSIENEYSGWPVDPENPLLHRATKVFHELFSREARVEAIHAGLECGLLREKFPNLKMISIGPDVVNPHSPKELLCLDTLGDFWTYFKGLLQNFCDRRTLSV